MQEVTLKVGDQEYILNNNSGKYSRVFDEIRGAGRNATPEQILVHYDRFGGLILDKNRNKIENGKFWKAYEEKIIRKKKIERNLETIGKITSHPIVAALILIIIFGLIWYFFGIDLSRFN